MTSILGLLILIWLGASIISQIPTTILAMTRVHSQRALKNMAPMLRVIYPLVWTMKLVWVIRMLGYTPFSLLFGGSWAGKNQRCSIRLRRGSPRTTYTTIGRHPSRFGSQAGAGLQDIPHTSPQGLPFTNTPQAEAFPESPDR